MNRFPHSSSRRQANGGSGKTKPRFRPAVELLEDRNLLSVSLVNVPTWVDQGPAPITGGQTSGLTDSPVVGAVQSIAMHPINPSVAFIGTVNGGVWGTTSFVSGS